MGPAVRSTCRASPSSCCAGAPSSRSSAFAAAVTEAAVTELGARPGDVRIAFEHIEPDDVANGGVLASEDSSRSSVLSGLGHSAAGSPG